MTFLKNHLSRAEGDSLPYWFRAAFAAVFASNHSLRECPLSAIANRFEFRCQPKTIDVIALQNLAFLCSS